MKKRLVVLLVTVLALAGCLKESEPYVCTPEVVTIKAPDNEISALRGILAGNGITATEDPRGFFYNISGPGAGPNPTTCSGITVDYVAKLLSNDSTVDAGYNAGFYLSGLITGWQEALPLIATGGGMTLYLPPSLAYGSMAVGIIPANSNLKFTIALKDVY
jgi:FKBP-type peptidyl-prolyl cis-trans isomerase FkpA